MNLNDELELIRKAKLENSEEAKQQLYNQWEMFIYKIADGYKSCGLEYEEIISEAKVGFFYAFERFDLDRGVKFPTYAANWIRERILDAIKKNYRKVGVPYTKLGMINKMKKLMAQADSMNLSDEEKDAYLLTNLKITKSKLEELKSIDYTATNVKSINDENVTLPVDETSVEEVVINEELKNLIQESLHILDKKERFVIESIFFHDKNLKDVVPENKTLKEYSLIKKKALLKLKNYLTEANAFDYL